MRNQTLPFLVLSLAAVACSAYDAAPASSEPDPTRTGDASPSPASPSASGSSSASSSGTPGTPAKHPVQGTLVDYFGVPAPDARIRVVDASGNVQDAKANASGAFSFADVAAPYDVRVLPPEGVVGAPQAYFGLSQAELRVTVRMAAASPLVWNKGIVTVPVNVGACPSCIVQIYTTSPGGGLGRNSFTAANVSSTTSVAVEHQWATSGNPAPSGTITVDVLVSDTAYTTFQYKRSSGGVLQPGGTMSVYAISPTPIGKFGPVTITVNDAEVPAAWNRDLQVFLKLPGTESSMYLQRVASPSLVTNVPNVPGATFSVGAWARGETKYDAEYEVVVDRSAGTTTADQPLSTATATATLLAGPAMIRPLPEGELSLQGPGLAWTAKPGRVVDVSLSDVSAKKMVARLVTTEAGLSFARLAKLGLTLEAGPHVLKVETYDGTVGGLLTNPPAPGTRAWTRDDYRFTVTP